MKNVKCLTEKSIENLIRNTSVVDYLDTPEADGMMLAHSTDKREDYAIKAYYTL